VIKCSWVIKKRYKMEKSIRKRYDGIFKAKFVSEANRYPRLYRRGT